MEPHLTVAIPTFNRPEQLRETLARLVPQLGPECTVVILDNASEVPVESQLCVWGWEGHPGVRCVRHAVNVGLTANILRCFEFAETRWLVVLGDDDEISADYVDAFLDAITRHPDATYGTFSTSIFERAQDHATDGLGDFIRGIDDWSNVLFISCCLFNREKVIPYLRFGYLYAYSLAPHIAMLLSCLRERGGHCLFFSRKVVNYRRDENTVTWSRVNISNTALIIELLPDRTLQQHLYDRMAPTFLPISALSMRLVEAAAESGEDQDLRFRFRALTTTCLGLPWWSAVQRATFGYLVRHPRLLEILAHLFRTITRRRQVRAQGADLHTGM